MDDSEDEETAQPTKADSKKPYKPDVITVVKVSVHSIGVIPAEH